MTTEVDHLGYRKLGTAECVGLLWRERVGRLAVVIGGAPEILPVNYVIDEAHVVFRSGGGTKLEALRDGAKVAFEVDGTSPRRRSRTTCRTCCSSSGCTA